MIDTPARLHRSFRGLSVVYDMSTNEIFAFPIILATHALLSHITYDCAIYSLEYFFRGIRMTRIIIARIALENFDKCGMELILLCIGGISLLRLKEKLTMYR